eukprot:9487483-Pyramimonas_sp.AAC.1
MFESFLVTRVKAMEHAPDIDRAKKTLASLVLGSCEADVALRDICSHALSWTHGLRSGAYKAVLDMLKEKIGQHLQTIWENISLVCVERLGKISDLLYEALLVLDDSGDQVLTGWVKRCDEA